MKRKKVIGRKKAQKAQKGVQKEHEVSHSFFRLLCLFAANPLDEFSSSVPIRVIRGYSSSSVSVCFDLLDFFRGAPSAALPAASLA